jgi:DNA-binding transcriptional MerR regulator
MENGNRNQYLPVYNIKAVANLVGLLPVTLRAWERRYGLPLPHRGDQGYRMYSEYDLRILNWLKTQLDAGLSISRAVEYLNELRAAGKDPALEQPIKQTQPSISTLYLAGQFREALEHFKDQNAADILRRAFTIYSVDTVLLEIIQPTLITLGEGWHRGDLPIIVEHFATQFCMQHLNSLLSSSAQPNRPGVIVAACAPGETHEIGLLSLVVMLRWRGWDVKYLGPNLKLDRIAEALTPLRPNILLFTATLPENARNLNELEPLLKNFPQPHPLVILGGQAFEHTHLPDSLPAVYLSGSPTTIVESIEKFMHQMHR